MLDPAGFGATPTPGDTYTRDVTRPLPIACTLSPTDLTARGAELRALGDDGLLELSEDDGRAVLRFRADPDVRARIEAIVAAESECCAFLSFRLEHAADASVLTIGAANGGAEVMHELAAAFAGR
jgi:hypothetical protein